QQCAHPVAETGRGGRCAARLGCGSRPGAGGHIGGTRCGARGDVGEGAGRAGGSRGCRPGALAWRALREGGRVLRERLAGEVPAVAGRAAVTALFSAARVVVVDPGEGEFGVAAGEIAPLATVDAAGRRHPGRTFAQVVAAAEGDAAARAMRTGPI